MRGPPQTEAKDTRTLLRACQDVGARQGQAITEEWEDRGLFDETGAPDWQAGETCSCSVLPESQWGPLQAASISVSDSSVSPKQRTLEDVLQSFLFLLILYVLSLK